MKRACFFAFFWIFIVWPAWAAGSGDLPRVVDFDHDGVVVTSDFEGGRLSEFSSTGTNKFTAVISPERRPMNNEQAWYAFRISSSDRRKVEVTLSFTDDKRNLFAPKVSHDRKIWEPLPPSAVRPAGDGKGIVLTLEIGPDPLWVAAQELFTESDFTAWIESLATRPFVKTANIGLSAEGRPIRKVEITEAAPDAPLVVVIGRQHPPEVTGTLGLKAFVETLTGDTPLAKEFRRKYKVLVIPLANPDGVNAGNWRFNTQGVDVNRDWGTFYQKETTVLRDEILKAREQARGDFPFFIDYHSTLKDVFYPRPEVKSNKPDSALEPPDRLMRQWLARVRELTPGSKTPIEVSPATREKKLNATSWARSLGSASVTHEFAHTTDRALIQKAGQADAVAVMELLTKEPQRAGE